MNVSSGSASAHWASDAISELLLATELDDEQRELAQTISSSGEALAVIVDDILDFSKIEAGKLKLDLTEFALRDMVERACGMLAARAYDKGLEFVVAVEPEVPKLVRGDAARLGQVIANFVSNAIKFTASGELVVHVTSRPEESGSDLRTVASHRLIALRRARVRIKRSRRVRAPACPSARHAVQRSLLVGDGSTG